MSKSGRGPVAKRRLFSRDYAVLYLMLVPLVIYYVLFCYGPMYGLVVAFKDYRPFTGIWGSRWVGMKHFSMMATDRYLWNSLRNTLSINFFKLILGFPIPILLTLLINEIRNGLFKRVVQTVVYFPRFLSWVIVAAIFSSLLSPQRGIINTLLVELGLFAEPVYFLGRNDTIQGIYVATDIWKGAGWSTVIYLAAITGINPEIYESSFLDGATRLQRMVYITIPSILPTICIMLILQVGALLNANFDQVVSMYNPMVYEKGDIIDTFVYRNLIQSGQVGYSTAAGLLKSIVSTALLVTANQFSKLVGQDGFF